MTVCLLHMRQEVEKIYTKNMIQDSSHTSTICILHLHLPHPFSHRESALVHTTTLPDMTLEAAGLYGGCNTSARELN